MRPLVRLPWLLLDGYAATVQGVPLDTWLLALDDTDRALLDGLARFVRRLRWGA